MSASRGEGSAEYRTGGDSNPHPTYADPFVEGIITALREWKPDVTDMQIGEFLAMVDDHVARIKEVRGGK